MVEFTSAQLSDPRLTAEVRAQFLNIGQLFDWKLIDASGSYNGLLVVGEIAMGKGFQTIMSTMIDVPPGPGIPYAKVQEITAVVNDEVRKRSIVILDKR